MCFTNKAVESDSEAPQAPKPPTPAAVHPSPRQARPAEKQFKPSEFDISVAARILLLSERGWAGVSPTLAEQLALLQKFILSSDVKCNCNSGNRNRYNRYPELSAFLHTAVEEYPSLARQARYRDTLHAKPEACCPVFYFRAIKKHFNSRLLAQQDAERRSRSRPRSRPTPSASPRVATRPPGAAVPVPYRAIVPAHWEVFQRRLEKDVATKVAVFGHRRGRGTVPITPRLNLVPLSNGACCSNPTRKAKQILMAGVVDPIVRDMFPGAKIYVNYIVFMNKREACCSLGFVNDAKAILDNIALMAR